MYESLQVLTGGAVLTTISVYLPGYKLPQRLSVPAVTAQCTLWQQGTNISVPVYPNPDGTGVPLAQPIRPDGDGRLPGYVLQPQLIDLKITGSNLQPRTLTIGFADDPRVIGAEEVVHKGQANGYPELDANALIPKLRIPGRTATPVQGAWDAIEITDATVTLAAPQEVQSVQAAWGLWAVGKTIALTGALAGNTTLVTTIDAITAGGNAHIVNPVTQAVTNLRAIVGTDDTQAWIDAESRQTTKPGSALALREGISLTRHRLMVAANGSLRGGGKGVTKVALIDAAAGIQYGPSFVLGGTAQPASYGRNEGFTIDALWLAQQPLFINAVNGAFDDLGAIYGTGDGIICGGQNCTFDNLNSGAHLGALLVLDNGCGGYSFEKPELNFAGTYHIVIRSSQNAEGVGYGVPEYNYFAHGICEARNSFAIGGEVGTSCVLITAGRFNMFDDMNFYLDSWDPADTVRAMVRIRGIGSGATNPDGNYFTNGDHEFRSCTWTGPGSGQGIEHDTLNGSGQAGTFYSVYRPYQVFGHTVVAGLDYFESHASLTRPREWGQVTLA